MSGHFEANISIIDSMAIEKLIEGVATGAIGAFGGVSYYLYETSKGRPFRLSMFCINIFLAFFIGWVTGQFFSEPSQYRDGVIAVSGFCSFPILNIIEKQFPVIFSNFLK